MNPYKIIRSGYALKSNIKMSAELVVGFRTNVKVIRWDYKTPTIPWLKKNLRREHEKRTTRERRVTLPRNKDVNRITK